MTTPDVPDTPEGSIALQQALAPLKQQCAAFAQSIPINEAMLASLHMAVVDLEARAAAGEAVEQDLASAHDQLDEAAPLLEYLIDQARGVVSGSERVIAEIRRVFMASELAQTVDSTSASGYAGSSPA